MEEVHFKESDRRNLRRVFTELVDFVHANKLQQVIAVGPSAQPYVVALSRAYKQRHGKELHAVSLGRIGETIRSMSFLPFKSKVLNWLLQRHRPRFDRNLPSLVFDEVVSSGRSLRSVSTAFNEIGLPHKTATIALRQDSRFKPDYHGLDVRVVDPSIFFPMRGAKLENGKANVSYNLPFLRKFRKELCEIADSVLRAEKQ
ncbi:MAG: hypothetical protein V1644_03120 [Candidatus Micrarchaeota archaeon]